MKHDQAIRSNGKSGSIVHAIKIIMENWKRANVMQGAAAMAYYLLLSLIPLLLVLANVIPLLPLSPDQAISFIENSFPPDVATMLVPVVEDYLASASGGAISIGLLASIWSASNVFSTLRRVLDKVYGVELKNNFIIARVLSLVIMIAILLLVGSALFVFVFGEQILDFVRDYFEIEIPILQGFLHVRWITLPLILIIVTFIIYQFLPNHHLKLKYSIPGAILASVGLVILSQTFTIISRLMGGDAITNQTLGGFIVLMLFLFLSNTVILFGALINTLIFELKNNISVPDYEMQVHEKEEREKSKWPGYPDEADTILLKRKIYKIN